MNTYPHHAGYSEPSTSKDAAEAVEGSGKAQTLRDEVLRVLSGFSVCQKDGGPKRRQLTADEIAEELWESPFSIRPRVTELAKLGLIERTGERRKSSNGRPSHVWRLV